MQKIQCSSFNMLKILVIYMSLYLAKAMFINPFKHLDLNMAIQEQSLFREIFPVSLIECAKQCLSRPSTCQSFNYRRTLLLCQLSDSNDTSLVENTPSTVHSLISTWPREFIGKCSNITCSKGRYCDETDALCKISECDVIPKIPDMNTRNFDRSVGISVEYACSKERYVPFGNMNIACQSNGTWSSLEGKCILGYCENPPVADNSVIRFGSNKVGTVREYVCNKYYFMTGKSTITCQRDGTWTTTNFICHERCPISKGFRYIEEGDICYKIKHQATSHNEAERACWRENSTLITIRSRTMQDLMNVEIHNDPANSYHIDGKYETASNVWKDKDNRELIFTSWNMENFSEALCLGKPCIIVVGSAWTCGPCSTHAFPICEYGKCPESYRMYPNLNLCYKEHGSHKVNRTEAQRDCQNSDGHLLVIDSEEKQNYIESIDECNDEIFVAIQKKKPYTYTLLTDYGYRVGTSTSLTLQVKACKDVHVGLMSENDVNSTKLYEILIGGWGGTKSTIRRMKYSTNLVTVQSTELNCNEFREFTYSWKSGKIEAFRGDGTLILAYKDTSPYQVNFIGITGGIWADFIFKINIQEFYWISGWYMNGAWVDDNNRNMSYFKWNPGQPNGMLGSSGISLRKNTCSQGEHWFDTNPSQRRFFICEYP